MSHNRIMAAATACLSAFLLCISSAASAANVTLFYPSQDRADFSVDVPSNWKIEPADEEGGFVSATGPTGIRLSFRTIVSNDEDVKAAIEQSYQWLFESYDDVKMDDPTDSEENGMKGFSSAGVAKDKSDGHPVVIVMEWLDLKKSHLAEVGIEVDATDKAGLAAADTIMKSLRKR